MNRTLSVILILFSLSTPALADELIVLCYHDIVPDTRYGDDFAVSRSDFVAQMDYLETNGYTPVSLSDVQAAARNEKRLPKKPVLLTFDDGFKSYKKFVVPVLQIYGFPSVASIVTGWLDGNNIPPEYNNKIMSWKELRSLKEAPDVEIISHTHDLHTGVPSNPQGNTGPAGVTRIYSEISKKYETEKEFRQRISIDLKSSMTRLKDELGITPTGVTWPFGHWDNVMAVEARLLGMRVQLTLDDGPTPFNQLPVLNRIIITRDDRYDDFARKLHFQPQKDVKHRFVELTLEPFLNANPSEQDDLLDEMFDNVEAASVNTVIINPISRDGKTAFFPNNQLNVAVEILNRVSFQLHRRLYIKDVYLRLPSNVNVTDAQEFYTDLARLNWFTGVVFDGHTAKQVSEIKKIVDYYHPRSQFGHYGRTKLASSLDFIIVPVEVTPDTATIRQEVLAAKGLPTKLFVHLKADDSDSDVIPSLMETIQAIGIHNIGIAYEDAFYGPNTEHTITHQPGKRDLAVFGG